MNTRNQQTRFTVDPIRAFLSGLTSAGIFTRLFFRPRPSGRTSARPVNTLSCHRINSMFNPFPAQHKSSLPSGNLTTNSFYVRPTMKNWLNENIHAECQHVLTWVAKWMRFENNFSRSKKRYLLAKMAINTISHVLLRMKRNYTHLIGIFIKVINSFSQPNKKKNEHDYSKSDYELNQKWSRVESDWITWRNSQSHFA